MGTGVVVVVAIIGLFVAVDGHGFLGVLMVLYCCLGKQGSCVCVCVCVCITPCEVVGCLSPRMMLMELP